MGNVIKISQKCGSGDLNEEIIQHLNEIQSFCSSLFCFEIHKATSNEINLWYKIEKD